jgi:hypothetical protein
VPVEFVSDEQAAGFGRFVGVPSRADLERFLESEPQRVRILR